MDDQDEERTWLVPSVQGGLSLRLHRLILRSALGYIFTSDRALSGRNNYAVGSVTLGLIF